MLGASFDSVEANRKFAEKNDFNFQLLSDRDRSLALAYGAAETPQDRSAKRAAAVIGPDGRIREWHAKVDAR